MSGDHLPSQLAAAEGIPIAQLSPGLEDPGKRVVRGTVTIFWPYSIINKTIAFLLAEPDFRLRRAKGQVRVEFSGSSAKAVQDAGLGSGDQVALSLDGVELVTNDSTTRVPGTSLEWQLKFTERLLLQATISDSEDIKLIDIDHPTASDPEPASEQAPDPVLDLFQESPKTSEPVFATPARSAAKRPADYNAGLDEYASPAFLKRARVSYGSLFEGSLDIFDEDVGAKARATKRTKTGRYSGVWRYASRSPSPELQPREGEEADDASMADEPPATVTPSRPKMVDGGCQTVELETSPPRDVQVAAEARHDPSLSWQTPSKSTMVDSGVQSDLPDMVHTPVLASGFGQSPHMSMFTSGPGHYPPAFEQPSLGQVFGHDLQSGMGPPYAGGSFHSEAYPEAGLGQEMDTHGQYPTSYLEQPQFDPQMEVTSQPISESKPAHQDHHTTFIDGITEPQQVPWGLTSVQRPGSSARSSVHGSASLKDETLVEKTGTQAVPKDDWAEEHERRSREHHDDPEGEQAAFRVEEDRISEDGDGPEEGFTSRTDAERRFQARKEKEEGTAITEDSTSSDSDDDSDEEADHEEEDVGGDYDITTYPNLSNNQDDDEASDLESDYGQEVDEEILDPDVQDSEEDDIDEDAQNYGGEYDEYEEEYDEDEDEDQENRPPAPTGPPQIISLLSDSEDEEEEEVPTSVPVAPRQLPQYDGSADKMEDADDESDKENILRQSPSLDLSAEESGDESEIGTPTPKPREPASMPRSSQSAGASVPEDVGSPTADDDLETMSPIRLPRATASPHKNDSRQLSRDSEMLEAELEEELEQELAANARDGQTPEASGKGLRGLIVEGKQTTNKESKVEVDLERQTAGDASTDERLAEVTENPANNQEELTAETTQSKESKIAPQEASVADADVEPGAIEPTDIVMADTDETPEVAKYGEPKKPPEETAAYVVDEEQLIQSQLEDETMAEARETIIIETFTERPNEATLDESRKEQTSALQVTVEVYSEAMDVDRPGQSDMASPPVTQQTEIRSFEEVKLIETQSSGQDSEADDDAQLAQQLPTPGATQVTESFVSQSIVETEVTEEGIADVATRAAVSVERLENPASPSSPINEESSQIRGSSAQPSEAHSSLIAEDIAEEVNAAQPTPKRGRGHRRNKSDSKDSDPSVRLARASIASRRSTRLSDRTTPDSTRATRARSHSLALRSVSPDDDDDDTGVQLARAAIKSPSRAARETKEVATPETPGALKTQLAKSLRLDLPDSISLKSLRNHPGRSVDVLAVATTEPPEAKRAKGGPRGIMLAFNVTDHSIAPTLAVPVQIFRPHKAALPVVHPGDAILLRQFTSTAMTGRGFGLRANDNSSWAVFEREGSDELPQIRGPPVELSKGETSYAALLKQWYSGLDAKTKAKLDKANEAGPAGDTGKEDR